MNSELTIGAACAIYAMCLAPRELLKPWITKSGQGESVDCAIGISTGSAHREGQLVVRRSAAREKHTALWTAIGTLALAAAATVHPLLRAAADTFCPPPPDLPSAPWTAALLFAGVAGAALVLVKRRGAGTKHGMPTRGRRWRRVTGGGLAALIAMSLISVAATSRPVPDTSTSVSASADTCPPIASPSPSATPQGTTPSPSPPSSAAAGSSSSGRPPGVSGATTVPVPATGARMGIRDGVGR